ncbi:MAG: serine/threonine protein kinase [Kofleriaceae bacterium]|nr:serine/threonine protein kinase [Kofleriaceae bacterium]
MSQGTGKYRYQRRLGGGGMAEVFLGTTVGAEGFSRPVAIKRVLPSFSGDPQFAQMFVNEARLSAMLRHPNIVQVLDFDRDGEGRLFLVMELIEGKDLDDLAAAGPVPVPVVVHLISEVLRGLAHAHEMTTPDGRPLGIVHRDVSPHNVLLSWDGGVKVSDFGIAKAMLASGAGRSGSIKGKPMYMAPEQVLAPDSLDHRADIFATGVMCYELLTGRRLYQGHTNEEILTDVIQVARGWRPLVAPSVLRPELPWDVAQATLMMLAPDRNHRFASARDAFEALLRTTSASARGGELLEELLAARFPAEAPRRAHRSSGAHALLANPDGATYVVSPSPGGAVAGGGAVATPGTPRPSGVRAQMDAETRTLEPAPRATPRPPAGDVPTAPGKRRRRKRSPWPLLVVFVIAIGLGFALVLALR